MRYSNLFKLPIDLGIIPLILLLFNDNTRSDRSFVMSSDIVPDKYVRLKSISVTLP